MAYFWAAVNKISFSDSKLAMSSIVYSNQAEGAPYMNFI